MDSIDKGFVAVFAFLAILLLSFVGIAAYDGHLRAQMIAAAPDPLYAACAYDSSSSAVPASCYTLLSLNKDLPQ
jgi:hypothetical protein